MTPSYGAVSVASLELQRRFDDATFEPADDRRLGVDVFLAADRSLLEQLHRRLVLFLSDAVRGLGNLVLRSRDRAVADELLEAAELGAGVGHASLGGADLRLAAEGFFGAFAGLEPSQDGAGLVEFALQCGEAGLELVLAELADHFALGDALAFLHGELHEQRRGLGTRARRGAPLRRRRGRCECARRRRRRRPSSSPGGLARVARRRRGSSRWRLLRGA